MNAIAAFFAANSQDRALPRLISDLIQPLARTKSGVITLAALLPLLHCLSTHSSRMDVEAAKATADEALITFLETGTS